MNYIPSMITIGNFICGLLAVHSLIFHNIHSAVIFIFTGMFLDFFDGMAARKLNAVSDMGENWIHLPIWLHLALRHPCSPTVSLYMPCRLSGYYARWLTVFAECFGSLNLMLNKASFRRLSECRFHLRQCVSSFYAL